MTFLNVILLSIHVLVPVVLFQNWYLPDESTDTFFNNLSKPISRTGCPQIILSDNGSLFVADTTQQFVSNKNIQWKFALAKLRGKENLRNA